MVLWNLNLESSFQLQESPQQADNKKGLEEWQV